MRTRLFAVLHGGIEQQSLDVAQVGALAHHVQQPKAAASVAAELDANRPIGVHQFSAKCRTFPNCFQPIVLICRSLCCQLPPSNERLW
jgi:hypothetical protein